MSASGAPHHVVVRDSWQLARFTAPARHAAAAAAEEAPAARRLAPRDIALLLQHSRISAQLTQGELAQMAALPLPSVVSIENGAWRFPPADTLRRLSDVLGVQLVPQ